MIWHVVSYLAGILTGFAVVAILEFFDENKKYGTRYQDDDGNPMA